MNYFNGNGFTLNRNQLKYLVIIAMLIDHFAWAFVPLSTVPGQVMHFIGRLTGPTMAYFLYEGYIHTRNVRKYMLRMGIFALISWIPFSLFESGTWPTSDMGVIYTLFLGLIALWIWDRNLDQRIKVLLVVGLAAASTIGDWPIIDVILPLYLYICRDDEARKWKIFWIFTICMTLAFAPGATDYWWDGLYNLGMLMVPFLLQKHYNGEAGNKSAFHKWFFYVFYPAHLLVLYGLKLLIC